jgi:hypothetical protein
MRGSASGLAVCCLLITPLKSKAQSKDYPWKPAEEGEQGARPVFVNAR